MCRMHGGAAPQVKAKAQERLASLVDPAIDRLAQLILSQTDSVALAAVRDVLDRNALKSPDEIDANVNVNTDDGIRQLVIDRVLARLSAGRNQRSAVESDPGTSGEAPLLLG